MENEAYRKFVFELREKRQFSRVGNSVGGMMLLSTFLVFLLNLVTVVVLFLTGTDGLLGDDPFILMLQIAFSFLSLVVPALFLPVFTGDRIGDVFAARRVRAAVLFPLLLTGLGVTALANVGNHIFASVLSGIGMAPVGSDLPAPGGTFGVLLTLLSGAVAPALIEEFAMRGVLLGVVRKHYGNGAAVLISALVFGLMHGNLAQIPFAFLLGLYLGYITVISGSVFPAVILHFLNNLFSFGMDYLTAGMGPNAADVLSMLYFAVTLGLGLIGVICLVRSRSRESVSFAGAKKNTLGLCRAPLMIVWFAVMAVQVVLTQLGLY